MSSLGVSELDLLEFFEAEPELSEADVPWEYNDAVYQFDDGRFHLSFAIAPAQRDVRIIVSLAGTVAYELNAVSVQDILVRKEKGREWLEVAISATDSLALYLKPAILIRQQASRLG